MSYCTVLVCKVLDMFMFQIICIASSPNQTDEPSTKHNLISVLGVQDSHQEKIITVSGEGMVHSPDFPHTYPRNTALVWRLVSTNNMRIQLTFDDRFGLEDPEDGICK